MKFEEIQALGSRHELLTYERFPIAIERGEGCRVWDTAGKGYLDLYGGHAVCSTGHCHPKVVAAIQEQARKLLFYSASVHHEARARAAEALCSFAPPGEWKVFLCNSGTEANETAMKIARKLTGRPRVLSMDGSFHGRTIGALSATALPGYRTAFSPLVPEHLFAEFGKISSAKSFLDSRVAAVIIEPVQSMAGVRVAAPEYYQELRKNCTEKGTLLIADEIQTGIGRTGKPFALDHWGVVPDLIALAKGIGSGVPVGAVLIKEEIARTIKPGEHGTTFGGGPIASAAVAATLGAIREEKLIENAAAVGETFRKLLKELPEVEEVRGMGCILGVKTKLPAKDVQKALLAEGALVGTAPGDPNLLRLLPPLTLSQAEVQEAVDLLKKVLTKKG